MKIEKYAKKIPINRWTDLSKKEIKELISKDRLIFRGQKDSTLGLKTSFDRMCKTFGIQVGDREKIEHGLIRKFRREAYRYLKHVPEKNNIVEWLSIMQHYGAPTRLLDWSHSFYVALYFALEDCKKTCAVWCLDSQWADATAKEIVGKIDEIEKKDRNYCRRKNWEAVFEDKKRFILTLNPLRFNERLIIQQGKFACPGDVRYSFEKNLIQSFAADVKSKSQEHFFKIEINIEPNKIKKEFIQNLHRMNMNAGTLYPGLEGFARSLGKTLPAIPNILEPDERYRKTHKDYP